MSDSPSSFGASDVKIVEGFETIRMLVAQVDGNTIRPSLAKKIAKNMQTYLERFEKRLADTGSVLEFSGVGGTKEELLALIEQVKVCTDKEAVIKFMEDFHKKMVDSLLILGIQNL